MVAFNRFGKSDLFVTLANFVLLQANLIIQQGLYFFLLQARIAQLVAYQLGTREVLGSNPGKGENFSVKISNWIVRI